MDYNKIDQMVSDLTQQTLAQLETRIIDVLKSYLNTTDMDKIMLAAKERCEKVKYEGDDYEHLICDGIRLISWKFETSFDQSGIKTEIIFK